MAFKKINGEKDGDFMSRIQTEAGRAFLNKDREGLQGLVEAVKEHYAGREDSLYRSFVPESQEILTPPSGKRFVYSDIPPQVSAKSIHEETKYGKGIAASAYAELTGDLTAMNATEYGGLGVTISDKKENAPGRSFEFGENQLKYATIEGDGLKWAKFYGTDVLTDIFFGENQSEASLEGAVRHQDGDTFKGLVPRSRYNPEIDLVL